MAAQAAVAAVRKGCEMLSEGRAEVGKLKKTVEQGIGDAKAIYSEVVGLWGWLLGLFQGRKPEKQIPAIAPASTEVAGASHPKKAPKPRRSAEPELSYEEYQTQAIHQVCEQLKAFFEIRRKLKEHCLELEEISKTTSTIEDSALDRVEIELQLENMTVQLREAMVYAPEELRNIYSRFLEMYSLILEEQQFARQVKRKKERNAKWQRELLRNHRIDRATVAVIAALVILWMWGFLLSLGWLVKTHVGLSPA